MFIYKINGNVLLSTDQPENCDFLEIDKLPEGEGKLCTDLKTVWYEPWPEEPPKEAPMEAKLQAQQERIEFLEDCIAEMAAEIYK